MNELMDVIGNHRSIRAFSSQRVEQTLLETILGVAQMASTSNFIQAYSVIQVIDQEKRKSLSEFAGHQAYVEQAPVFLVFCADLYRISMTIKEINENPDFSTLENFLLTTIDTSLFAQNVILAAESVGLGGVYIGGIRNNPRAVNEILDLPDLVVPLFGMCLGYPNDKPEQKQRLPLSVILHHDTYRKEKIKEIKKYDEEIHEYYVQRTNGKVSDTWSQKMTKLFSKPLRQDLKQFIIDKGFKLE